MGKKKEEPNYNEMLEYILETIGATVSVEDDQRVIDALISSNIPQNLIIETLVKKLRDYERDFHYSRG